MSNKKTGLTFYDNMPRFKMNSDKWHHILINIEEAEAKIIRLQRRKQILKSACIITMTLIVLAAIPFASFTEKGAQVTQHVIQFGSSLLSPEQDTSAVNSWTLSSRFEHEGSESTLFYSYRGLIHPDRSRRTV
jgi:hypothetical protein